MRDYPPITISGIRIRESFIRAHPDWVFLYSDAWLNKGGLGQGIAFHGEPNTYRIPTCHKYCTNPVYYDDRVQDYWDEVDSAFALVPSADIIIPCPKMGCGFSRMKEFAPKLFAYMQERVKAIQYPNIIWDYTS